MSDNKLPTGTGGQQLPFVTAKQAGGFLFVSGQVSMDHDGNFVDGDIVVQARQTFANIERILKEHGYGMEHVVKVNVWLDDARDFNAFNKVFKELFLAHPPARSTVVSPLVIDGKIEADVIAYKE